MSWNTIHVFSDGQDSWLGKPIGGEASTVNASHSSILGGCANTIGATAVFSNIAGGCFNRIDADISSIAGGQNNKVSADCSAILGGQNNTVNVGHVFSAVFGNGLNSVAANTLHIACLNAIGTPAFGGGGFPAGTVYYAIGTPPPGAKALYIV
jgi:hypothetical protein